MLVTLIIKDHWSLSLRESRKWNDGLRFESSHPGFDFFDGPGNDGQDLAAGLSHGHVLLDPDAPKVPELLEMGHDAKLEQESQLVAKES